MPPSRARRDKPASVRHEARSLFKLRRIYKQNCFMLFSDEQWLQFLILEWQDFARLVR